MAPVGCVSDGNNAIRLQVILYFAASFLGFFVTIPVGIVLRNFQGSCILFAQIVQWTTAIIWPWSETSCDFVLYVNLAINIFYATFMGALTLFMLLRRTNTNLTKIGTLQDWHISFVLTALNPIFLFINSLVVVLEISGASIITAGLSTFCNYTLKYAQSLPHINGTNYVPTSCAGLDARWNHEWQHLRIVRGGDRGVKGDNFFGCLTLATIASWLLLCVWIVQLALNILMSCRVCSCDIAEEKRKPDQSMLIAQRRSRLATPIATPGGFMTPGGSTGGRQTPQGMRHPMAGPPRMVPMGVGGAAPPPDYGDAEKYPPRGGERGPGPPPALEKTPSYPSDEEKKPLPSSFEEDDVSRGGGYDPPPPAMKPLQGKQVFKRNQDSMI